MATTEVFLEEIFDVDLERSGKRFLTDWLSNAGGAYTEQVIMRGWLVAVKTKPDGGGTAPTDNYDIELIDADGFDVLQGLLRDRDTANVEQYPHPETDKGVTVICYLNGTYTLTVSNAGNAKGGEITWFLKNR